MSTRATVQARIEAAGFEIIRQGRDDYGQWTGYRIRCDSCQALSINGRACHETGCRNSPRECPWCGEEFVREHECRAFEGD